MENEKITGVLKDILYQLHVITSQNFTAMAHSDSFVLRDYGAKGLQAEARWMQGTMENKVKEVEAECPSENSCSSESSSVSL